MRAHYGSQDFQLEQQQQQRRSRSLRTPAHELISSESKKKADAAAAGNSHDAFAASLLPEDIHTGLPMFFMKSSEIYARIRAIRANPSRREEQRALAEEIMKMRKVPMVYSHCACCRVFVTIHCSLRLCSSF